jgi:hypothetical protein
MRRFTIAALVLLAIAGAYSLSYPTTTYRFRITINVDTPQGPRSGSSVMEVRHRRYPAWTTLGNSTGESSLKGEAVFVDLGAGADGKPRNLIALLAHGPRAENIDFYLLPGRVFEPLWKQKSATTAFRVPSTELSLLPVGTKAELVGSQIPTLVTFTDLNDPKTAQVVPPYELSKLFGSGVQLRSATIEMVPAGIWPLTLLGLSGDPVTQGIEKNLSWVARLRSEGLGDRIRTYPEQFTINVLTSLGADNGGF